MNGNAMVQEVMEAWQYHILDNKKGGPEDLARQCIELGSIGWELVAAIPMAAPLNGGATTCVRLFFKRRWTQ